MDRVRGLAELEVGLHEEALAGVGRGRWNVNESIGLGELGARDEGRGEERVDVRAAGVCSFFLARGKSVRGCLRGLKPNKFPNTMPAGRVRELVGLEATKALEGGCRRGVTRLRLRNSASCRCRRTSCRAPHGQHGAVIPTVAGSDA